MRINTQTVPLGTTKYQYSSVQTNYELQYVYKYDVKLFYFRQYTKRKYREIQFRI